MDLHFRDPGFAYMIERILDFQQEDTAPFWSEPLYAFYPQLDKAYALSLPLSSRRGYIEETLRGVYEAERESLTQKCHAYAAHWEACRP